MRTVANTHARTALGFENCALLVTLSDVDECLGIENLLSSLAFCLHLQFELLLDITIRGVKILDLETSAVHTPFL